MVVVVVGGGCADEKLISSWGHLTTTNCCCKVLWGSRPVYWSTHTCSFKMVGSSAYTQAQTLKNKQNSQIVNSNLKLDRDFHLWLTIHLNKGIFHNPDKINHKIDKLTGFNAPVVKIPNFDQGFYNSSLVLNEILGQSKFLCPGATHMI